MLVRRIATVTISAPAASVARRVSSRSLNLPVPVSRRERYGLPAMTSVSAARGDSARAFMAVGIGWVERVIFADSERGCAAASKRPRRGSAAADRVHDLDAIAVGEPMLGMAAARDDLAVDFDRDAPRRVARGLEQFGERAGACD